MQVIYSRTHTHSHSSTVSLQYTANKRSKWLDTSWHIDFRTTVCHNSHQLSNQRRFGWKLRNIKRALSCRHWQCFEPHDTAYGFQDALEWFGMSQCCVTSMAGLIDLHRIFVKITFSHIMQWAEKLATCKTKDSNKCTNPFQHVEKNLHSILSLWLMVSQMNY